MNSDMAVENIKLQRDQAIAECHRLQAAQRALRIGLDDWLDYLATRNPWVFAGLTVEDKQVLWRLVEDAQGIRQTVHEQYMPEQEGKSYTRVLQGRFAIPPEVPVQSVGGLWINRYGPSRCLNLRGFEILEEEM